MRKKFGPAPSFSSRFALGFQEKEAVVQLLDHDGKAQRTQQLLDEVQIMQHLHNEKRLTVA